MAVRMRLGPRRVHLELQIAPRAACIQQKANSSKNLIPHIAYNRSVVGKTRRPSQLAVRAADQHNTR